MSSDLNGSLYSSNAQVRRVLQVFLQMHQCKLCGRYFTEMENLGSWSCKYHPGEFNMLTRKWTCCGETERITRSRYAGFEDQMVWSKHQQLPPVHTQGCCRRDCISKYKNPIPQEEVLLEEVACIIPQMKEHGSDLEKRPGLVRGAKVRIERKESLPEIFFDSSNVF